MTPWSVLRKGAWILAGAAVIALCLLLLIGDVLIFLVSYSNPADSYTGQDGDRAVSWIWLGMLVAASALAFAVVRLPVTYRRLRDSATANGQGLTTLLAGQHFWRLVRTLMTFNTPIMIVVAAVVVYETVVTTHPQSTPAGTFLWAATAGVIIAASVTTLEVFLLRIARTRPAAKDGPGTGER
jgi:hypothetical protein